MSWLDFMFGMLNWRTFTVPVSVLYLLYGPAKVPSMAVYIFGVRVFARVGVK